MDLYSCGMFGASERKIFGQALMTVCEKRGGHGPGTLVKYLFLVTCQAISIGLA